MNMLWSTSYEKEKESTNTILIGHLLLLYRELSNYSAKGMPD